MTRTFSTIVRSRSSPSGPPRLEFRFLRDVLDVHLDVARELGDLVEADGDVSLDRRSLGQRRRADRARDELDVFLAEQPEVGDRGGRALAQVHVGLSRSMSTIAPCPSLVSWILATLPTANPGQAGPWTSRPGPRRP